MSVRMWQQTERRIEIPNTSKVDQWEQRRQGRFERLSTLLGMPVEAIPDFVKMYCEVICAQQSLRTFVLAYYGLNSQECLTRTMLARRARLSIGLAAMEELRQMMIS